MQVRYQYKDKSFDDIRDIVHNNKLEPDFDVIINEYIPFQIFISGKTLFKGVNIRPTVSYYAGQMREDLFEDIEGIDFKKFFSESVNDYLERHEFYKAKNPIAAVSGGVDSSVVALELKPKIIYSGYYDGDEYDETRYSSKISSLIQSQHLIFRLTEDDFIENVFDCAEAVCVPAGGFGSVMEYAVLKKVLGKVDSDAVLFGHGGDEIFMGYFFNHFIRLFYQSGKEEPSYMPNFAPSKRELVESTIDFMIVMSINRCGRNVFRLPFVKSWMYPILSNIDDVLSKLLCVNINWTLPTLLHLNGQICRSLGVEGYSPLANKDFVRLAWWLNSSVPLIRTKYRLRTVHRDIPEEISLERNKRGFPIPVGRWGRLDQMMKVTSEKFFKRAGRSWHYSGVNRDMWGVFQAELFLERFGF